jgi:shikimate kinase
MAHREQRALRSLVARISLVATGGTRDVLEAVDARHFLDQVFLDLDVEAVATAASRGTPRRHVRSEARRVKMSAISASSATPITRPRAHAHLHRLALRQVDDLVVDRAGLAAADFENQRVMRSMCSTVVA